MKGNQTGVAVTAGEVEDGGGGGGGGLPVRPEQPCQPEHFSRFKKNNSACATSRDENTFRAPVLFIPHAQMWSCRYVFVRRD